MKVLLDIKEDKADFVMELLRNLKFVKAQTLTPYKADVLEGVKEGAQEAVQIQKGTLRGIPARELLNEL